jgi:hypothetical protein
VRATLETQVAERKRHVLTDQLTEGHALACGDVLKAGYDQVIVGWRGNPQKVHPVGIKLFTPLDQQGEKWRESFIDDDGMGCEDLVLADLNGDEKLDVVASGALDPECEGLSQRNSELGGCLPTSASGDYVVEARRECKTPRFSGSGTSGAFIGDLHT